MKLNFLTKVLSKTTLRIPKHDIPPHPPNPHYHESPGRLRDTKLLGTLITVVASGDKTITLQKRTPEV